MKTFCLPDLGEGLQDAEIVQWAVKPGDDLHQGQTMLTVETAKAIVDIPAPEDCRIVCCHGRTGQTLAVGSLLVEYLTATDRRAHPHLDPQMSRQTESADHGSVVGELPVATTSVGPGEALIIGSESLVPDGYETLQGMRRSMARSMTTAQSQVARVTLFDAVSIKNPKHVLPALLHALDAACRAEPSLNCWYQPWPPARKIHTEVRIGLAINTADGLFVPVLPAGPHSLSDWRKYSDGLREKTEQRKLQPADMQGATITLSSFGMLGGRYATPIVLPPQVAILGVGRFSRISSKKIELPLSLSFDHRAATGAEAARFLESFRQAIKKIRDR